MLSVGRSGLVVRDETPWVGQAQRHFTARNWVAIPGFLGGDVLRTVLDGLKAARFHDAVRDCDEPVCRLVMEGDATVSMLSLFCNDPALFSIVQQITGCGPVQFFDGSVYRLTPAASIHYPWHNDFVEGRRVALTVNLSPDAYDGGVLEIREPAAPGQIQEAPNRGAGDAVLFRIGRDVEHRVTALTGGTKTAFAGWFSEAPSLLDRLHARVASRKGDRC
ncbi:MAG TPA: 2OG-Fe(II) oxygenase [Vicinamibacterales bacterium]|nr:2OG-Fe(II) oxygenase [Vicinamibacterales bacterium]